MSISRELKAYGTDQLQDRHNQDIRDEDRLRVDALDVLTDKSSIKEGLATRNYWNLATGTFPGFTLAKPMGAVRGLSGRSMVQGKVTLEADTDLEGVTFLGQEVGDTPSVVIGASAKVMFRGCTFLMSSLHVDTVVTLKNGGRAFFVHCWFRGTKGAGGNVIDVLSGNALHCRVGFSYNLTGNPLGVVTSTEVMT